jgi:Nucleotide-diphospho-sugar transferase
MGSSDESKNSCGGATPSRLMAIVLLISILAHGVMFSSKSLKSVGFTSYYQTSEATASGSATTSQSMISSFWNNGWNDLSIQMHQRLPHWRVAVDCSVYNLDCFSRVKREHRYLPYPFPPTHVDTQTEFLRDFPDEWKQILQSQQITNYSKAPEVSIQNVHSLFPPMVEDEEYQKCLALAGIQGGDDSPKTTLQQLDEMLASGKLTVEPHTNMIAFTISDYSYTQDMMHDMFQMMDHVVGFSPKHFFLVAIDVPTVEMGCRHGYPVIFWRESKTESLRDAVANTKIILSLELVNRGIAFFFTEMDVWWIESPKSDILAFQKIDSNQTSENHLYFSPHQNNPWAANIGVYASKANKYTQEYFKICIDVLKQRPETHDQWAMQQVHHLFEKTLWGQGFEFGGDWGPKGPPPVPKVKYPFHARYWGPHTIVADERPMPTSETLAIHTLCSTPLLNPHGKKMIAREIGAYYGFRSNPTPYFTVGDFQGSNVAISEAAGYYTRSGSKNRRYLALDGPLRTNFYSTSLIEGYHSNRFFQWTVTVMLAIARWTSRIFILPHVFIADMDAGS